MPVQQTAPNGSFTDRLFGFIGQAVDTVGQVQIARLNRTPDAPSPNSDPRARTNPDDADTLRTQPASATTTASGMAAVPPWAWLAGAAAAVGLTVLLLRK